MDELNEREEPEKMEKNKKNDKKEKSAGPGYLEVVVIALIVAAGAIAGYDRMFAQKIKVVDLKGYVRTQKALLAAGEIDQNQLRINLDKLDQAVAEAAVDHHNIILLKEVVLKNGNEISIK